MRPTTAKEARRRGLPRYFTGKPCIKGHVCERRTHKHICIECNRAYSKAWAAANKAVVTEMQKEWKRNAPYTAMALVKRGASKKLNVPFDLDGEYLRSIVPADMICPILLIPMTLPGDSGPLSNRMSLDRRKPELGYTKGNVTFMSFRANRIKSDCSDAAVFGRLFSYLSHSSLSIGGKVTRQVSRDTR